MTSNNSYDCPLRNESDQTRFDELYTSFLLLQWTRNKTIWILLINYKSIKTLALRQR